MFKKERLKNMTTTFTKKHYEKIAFVLGKHFINEERGCNTHHLIDEMIKLFKKDNPRFNKDIFLDYITDVVGELRKVPLDDLSRKERGI